MKKTKNKRTKIENFLYNYHKGEENAIHCKQLQLKYKSDRGSIQYHIRTLRRMNVPICSSRKGYFYANTFAEIGETIDYLNKMRNGFTHTMDGLRGSMAV